MRPMTISLLLVTLMGCSGIAHRSLDARDLAQWGDRYPAGARWVAMARCPEAIVRVWPAVEATGVGVDAPLTTPAVWVASELARIPNDSEREAWTNACALLAEAPGAERERVLGVLSDDLLWIEEWQGVEERLAQVETSAEGLMAAAFQDPATRDLFTPLLQRRGLDPNRVSPEMVGGTMTAGEHVAMRMSLICAVSQMSESHRERWFTVMEQRAPAIQP